VASSDDPVLLVVDDAERSRFVVEVDGVEAELRYRIDGARLIILHTGVPDRASGQGVGGALVRAALQRARRDHLRLVSWCPFARHWLSVHKDERADVEIDWGSHPPE
jgi:uncharacterized protein